MQNPRCPHCRMEIDLNTFRFMEDEVRKNPERRRAPEDILKRDPRFKGKSMLGMEETAALLGHKTHYARTFAQFMASTTASTPFGLINDPHIPPRARAIFDTAANLVLYSWFVREFAAVAVLVGYAALEATLRETQQKEATLGRLIGDIDREQLEQAIMAETI